MHKTVLVTVDVRSAHNIGSMLRTCDGLGVHMVYICGGSPYPILKNDPRLPHIAQKAHKEIHKTSLGAEDSVIWQYSESAHDVLINLKNEGYNIVALEQTASSVSLLNTKLNSPTVLVVGTEVTGLGNDILRLCDSAIEIPMVGTKESFNVSVAAAIALYEIAKQNAYSTKI